MSNLKNLQRELATLINRNSMDIFCNIPDFILSEYMINCALSLKQTNDLCKSWDDNETKTNQQNTLLLDPVGAFQRGRRAAFQIKAAEQDIARAAVEAADALIKGSTDKRTGER